MIRRKFQQGGSNIAIGSPKTYTTNMPGININPLTLTNAPIEINTTGITDQIQKMQDLKLKRDQLAFQYKELEYKEGRDFLNFMGDIMKTTMSAKQSVDAAGGVAALDRYRDIYSNQNRRKSEIIEKMSRNMGNFKVNGISMMKELSESLNDPEYLEAQLQVEGLNKALKLAQSGTLGIASGDITRKILEYASDKNSPLKFNDIMAEVGLMAGTGTTGDDISKLLTEFDKQWVPKQTTQGYELQPDGLRKEISRYIIPSEDVIAESFKRTLLGNPHGRIFLGQNGINYYNPNSTELNDFAREYAKQKRAELSAIYPETTKIAGSVIPGLIKNEDGSVSKEGKGGASGKEAQWQAKLRVGTEAAAQKYGPGFASRDDVQQVIMEVSDLEKRKEALDQIAKSLGLTVPTGGATGEGGESPLPDSLEGISKIVGLPVDKGLTKLVEKDGQKFLISADDKWRTKLTPWLKDNKTTYSDVEIRDMFGLGNTVFSFGRDAEDIWNTWGREPRAVVIPLGGSAKTSSGDTSWLRDDQKKDFENLSNDIKLIGKEIHNLVGEKPTSAFRSQYKNESVGGSPKSWHLKGAALDYSWNEQLFQELTEGSLKEKLDELGYEAQCHDGNAKKGDPCYSAGYGGRKHIHIQPKMSRQNFIREMWSRGGERTEDDEFYEEDSNTPELPAGVKPMGVFDF